jgi:hypothetical protein
MSSASSAVAVNVAEPAVAASSIIYIGTEPVFQRLEMDARDRVWAPHARASGAASTFDVFDAGGTRVAAVTSVLSFYASAPMFITADHLYGIVRDSDDVPYIVRARIVRQW